MRTAMRRSVIALHFDEEFVREAGDDVALFFSFAGLDTDEVGAVRVHDGDCFVLNADRIRAVFVRDDDFLRAAVPCQRDVVELFSVLRDDSMKRRTVLTRRKQSCGAGADEEKCGDEDEVSFLHKIALP